ncbi:class I SAM-dependent methyltransferase [Teichococcus vastitatis]|uniref:Class I SAM-dependent methyltransferase n=1 Tax=Teichococcus vastitatis TaxID=2307076 RepID=A0ABS9VZY0_9PROT|nr:class I SAM-dependent methyltransferase [Pseudoroseomonas vastitatis]MCI0752594.1 class I SAM-dependent methyltransferase [Pseudoroseomonas vastitatis]
MAQNIYDTPEFFEGYSRLPRSVHGLEGAPEWPAIQAMLPELQGRRVVDLGCGFGWFTRWARMQGASQVLGLDVSENMLARARADTADPAVQYAMADLETLNLSPGEFDLAYSSLAFHYIEDFGRLVRRVFRSLTPGAHLVFTIEHPIYMASTRPGWLAREDGQKTWPVDSYAIEGARTTDWLAKGVVKYHRTLGTTLNTLITSGFTIREVHEWHPTQQQIAEYPALAAEMERPMMVLISAQRGTEIGTAS